MNDWQSNISKSGWAHYHAAVTNVLGRIAGGETVYPHRDFWLRALDECDPSDVKVVILGQDPYHGEGEAHGLSFSVPEGTKMPPSLRNIYQELASDLGIRRTTTDLSDWARQGVMLLNTSLTVAKDNAGSHKDVGWEPFTDEVIRTVSGQPGKRVFILWGAHAQKKAPLIDKRHLVIRSAHPSPLSAYRGFFGSRPFSKTNEFLAANLIDTVEW